MIIKAGINEPKWLSGRWWMEDISIIIIGEYCGHWLFQNKSMGNCADEAIK